MGYYVIKRFADKKGLVTVSGHKDSDEIAAGTLKSIYKQAKLDK